MWIHICVCSHTHKRQLGEYTDVNRRGCREGNGDAGMGPREERAVYPSCFLFCPRGGFSVLKKLKSENNSRCVCYQSKSGDPC